MPFYLYPGDTLDITICFHDGDVPDCRYRGGHSAEVARLLKVRNDYLSLQKLCRFFEGDIEAYNHFADSLYTTWQRKIGAIADAHHFTSFERRLAECDMAAVFGTAYLSYFSQIQDKMAQDFRQRELFHLLALGLAQHYGLPSVGLDLTDDLKVALWFAIYKATYSNKEPVKAELIKDEDNEATIFVFRCHPRSVFRYSDLVQGIGAHRPDAQSAYFNYCGWGLAKNQLALDLACAFRVDASFAKELPENYIEHLFPKTDDDEVLRILLQIKDMYQGTELGEMMEKIYL